MDDRKGTIANILHGAKDKEKQRNVADKHDMSIVAGGNVNVIANSHIHKMHITPGAEHITEAQAARLSYLVHEVARLECIHSSNPVFMPAIWDALKAQLNVTSYKLIPHGHFSEAERFLLEWRHKVLADKARSPHIVKDRSRVYRICHAIAKRYGLYVEMRSYMQAKWGVASMRSLDEDALYQLLSFMRALEADQTPKQH